MLNIIHLISNRAYVQIRNNYIFFKLSLIDDRPRGHPRSTYAKFFEKHFLPPDTHTYVYVSGGKTCLFFGKFGFICFLEAPVLRFALWPYYQRHVHEPLFFSLPLMLLYSFHFYISVLSHHMFCALFYEVAWLSSSCFLILCIMIKL